MRNNHAAPSTSDRGRNATPSTAWRVLEAMAYAGALFDPTGALVIERLRRRQEGAA